MSDLVFILPIWVLFGTQELGLSITLTTALFMTIWIGSGILEIPTGALADRLGRKRMFLIGAALMTGYPLAYAAKVPVPIIFAVSGLAALGSALRSGTLIPLTHDAYKKDGRSDQEYHAFLSNERMLGFVARGISGILGGLLYATDPRAPYVAMFIVYIAIFITGWFVSDAASRSELSQTKHIGEAFHAMRHSQPVVMILGCYVALGLVAEAIWTAFQPFFVDDKIPVELIGLIFSGLALVSALGAYCVRFVMQRIGILSIELVLATLISITALLLVVPYRPLHVLSVVPIAFAFGMTLMPFTATVQKFTAKKFHSTALSVVGLLQFGVYGVASIYVGLVIDNFGIEVTRQVLCVGALAIVAGLVSYWKTHRHKDVIISPRNDSLVDEEIALAGVSS